MYSNPRMLTHENAPIITGIKLVYPKLSQSTDIQIETFREETFFSSVANFHFHVWTKNMGYDSFPSALQCINFTNKF